MEANDIISSALAQVAALKEIVEDKELRDPYDYREDLLNWLAMYGWHTTEDKASYKEDNFEFILSFDCRNYMFSLTMLDIDEHKSKTVKYHMQLI